jgi:competence protein ComEA
MNLIKKIAATWLISLLVASTLALAGVNLNTASETELESLPGVGSKVAKDIMAARPFKTVDDLKNVKGMGDKKFGKIAPLVSVDGSSTSGATAPVASAPTKAENVPTKVENAPAQPATRSAAPVASHSNSGKKKADLLGQGEKINLNTASKEELERLPGIGDKKAQSIIEGRPFKTPEDIMKVKGIKQGEFKKIQDHITT